MSTAVGRGAAAPDSASVHMIYCIDYILYLLALTYAIYIYIYTYICAYIYIYIYIYIHMGDVLSPPLIVDRRHWGSNLGPPASEGRPPPIELYMQLPSGPLLVPSPV